MKYTTLLAVLLVSVLIHLPVAVSAQTGPAVDLVVQWKGSGVLGELPEGVGGDVVPAGFPCVSVPMLDPQNDRRIGTGYDCVTDFGSLPVVGYGAVTTYYIMHFFNRGSIITENIVTVQPLVVGSMAGEFSHVVGGFPGDEEQTIKGGTRAFRDTNGKVRVSGGVNVLEFPPKLTFDYLFKVSFDK